MAFFFDLVGFDTIVAVSPRHQTVRILAQLLLYTLGIRSLDFRAVIGGGSSHDGFNSLRLESLLQRFQRLILGLVVNGDFINSLRDLFADSLIDFIAKNIIGQTDNIALIYFDIAVFINMDAVQIFFLDFLLFRFVHRGELCNNVHNRLRSTEDVGNVLEQIVGHKSAIHNFCGANLSRNRKHLFGIQFHHLAVFILTDDREEVQQFFDVLFAGFGITAPIGGAGIQVVGELLKNHKGSRRVEVEDIGVLLAVELAFVAEQAWILRTERRLHIQGRALDAAQHQHGCPFGNRNACGKLPDRQCNCLVVLGDSLGHTVKRFLGRIIVVQSAVPHCRDDLVILENRMVVQLACQSLGAVHTVQQPKRML